MPLAPPSKPLKSLEQVIKYIYSVDESSLQKTISESDKAVTTRLQHARTSEDAFNQEYGELVGKRMASELKAFEEVVTSKTRKELERIDELRRALEEKYKYEIEQVQKINTDTEKLSDHLTDKQIENYEKYNKQRKKLDEEHRQLTEGGSGFLSQKSFEKAQAGVEKGSSEGLTFGLVDALARKASKDPDKQDEVRKQLTGAGDIAGQIGKGIGISPMNVSVEKLVKIGLELQELYRENLRKTAELTSKGVGGTATGLASGEFDEMRQAMGRLKIAFSANQEEVEQVANRYHQLIPKLSPKELENAVSSFMFESIQMGMTATQLAETTGGLRKEFGLTEKEARGMTAIFANTAKDISNDATGLQVSTAELADWTMRAARSMNSLGVEVPLAANMISKFGDSLQRQVISIDQIIAAATGVTKKDEGIKAFLGLKTIESMSGPMGDKLKREAAGDAVHGAEILKMFSEGELAGPQRSERGSRLRSKLGIAEGAEGDAEVNKLKQEFLHSGMHQASQYAEKLSGGDPYKKDLIQRQLEQMLGGVSGVPQKQIEQLRQGLEPAELAKGVKSPTAELEGRKAAYDSSREFFVKTGNDLKAITGYAALIATYLTPQDATDKDKLAAMRVASQVSPAEVTAHQKLEYKGGTSAKEIGTDVALGAPGLLLAAKDLLGAAFNNFTDPGKKAERWAEDVSGALGKGMDPKDIVRKYGSAGPSEEDLKEKGSSLSQAGTFVSAREKMGYVPGVSENLNVNISGGVLDEKDRQELRNLLGRFMAAKGNEKQQEEIIREMDSLRRKGTAGGAAQ